MVCLPLITELDLVIVISSGSEKSPCNGERFLSRWRSFEMTYQECPSSLENRLLYGRTACALIRTTPPLLFALSQRANGFDTIISSPS
jgi:hypothetical protein